MIWTRDDAGWIDSQECFVRNFSSVFFLQSLSLSSPSSLPSSARLHYVTVLSYSVFHQCASRCFHFSFCIYAARFSD